MPRMMPSFAKAQDETAKAGDAIEDARKALQRVKIQPGSKLALKTLRAKVRLAEQRVAAAKSALRRLKSPRATVTVTECDFEKVLYPVSELDAATVTLSGNACEPVLRKMMR
jgi:hypothetical protein